MLQFSCCSLIVYCFLLGIEQVIDSEVSFSPLSFPYIDSTLYFSLSR